MTGLFANAFTEELSNRVARIFLLHQAAKVPKPLPSIFDVDPEDEAKLKEEFLAIFDQVEGKTPEKPSPPKQPKTLQEQDALWDQFLQAKFGQLGGNTLVKNTNPKTKDKYPKVQVDTLVETDSVFAKNLQAQFEQWKKQFEKEEYEGDLGSAIDEIEEKPQKETKEPVPTSGEGKGKGKPIKGLEDLKLHDLVWIVGAQGPVLVRVSEQPKVEGKGSIEFKGIDSTTGEDQNGPFEKDWKTFSLFDPVRADWKALSPGVRATIKKLKGKSSKPAAPESSVPEPSAQPIKLSEEEHTMLREWGSAGSGMYELGKRARDGEEITKDLLEEAAKEVEGLMSAGVHSPAFESELKKIDDSLKAAIKIAPSAPKKKKPVGPVSYPKIGIGGSIQHPSQVKEGDWVSLKSEKGDILGEVKKVHSTSFEIKDYKPDGTPWSDFEDDMAEIKLKHLTGEADAKLVDTPSWAQPKKTKLQGKKVKKLKQLSPFDVVTWEGEKGKRERGYVLRVDGKKALLQPVAKNGKPDGEPISITQAVLDGSELRRIPSSLVPSKLEKHLKGEKQKLKDKAQSKPFKQLTPGDKVFETNQLSPLTVESIDNVGQVSVAENDTPYLVEDLEKGPDGGVLHIPSGGLHEDKPADEKIKWVSLDPVGNTSDPGWKVFHPPEAMGGATPGVFYQGPDGQKYYVKMPPSEDHVRNEILAAKLYEAAGIKVPELHVVTHNGQMALASSYVPGLTYSPKKLQAGGVPQVAEGFGTDAWLANWDVVGKGNKANNMPIDPEGDAVRVDMGGALLYHGVGEPKEWSSFPTAVAEIEGFRSPSFSKSKIYKHISDTEIADSIQRILDIPDATIEKLVDKYGPTSPMKGKKLLERLMARRQNLAEQQKKYAQQAGKQAFLKQAALWKIANESRPALPEQFFLFLRDEFGPRGGQEKVRNTNYQSKDKYEQVAVFTLMRTDETFRRRVLRDFKLWEDRRKESQHHFEQREPTVDVDQEGWTQTGHKGGSNPGGFYKGPDGDEWYVKTPSTPDHANNEILSAEIYRLGDIEVPEIKAAKRHGQYSVASRIVPGLREDQKSLTSDDLPEGVAEGMAMDAWLGNWDVVGLTYDNLLLDEDDKAHRVDVGGALRYRAMGSPKGDKFGHQVTELSRMLNPQKQSGTVFSNMTDDQVIDSIQRVLDVDMEKVRDLVGQYGPPDQGAKTDLFKTLEARKKSLAVIQKEFEEGHGSKYRTEKAPPRDPHEMPDWLNDLTWSWESSDK